MNKDFKKFILSFFKLHLFKFVIIVLGAIFSALGLLMIPYLIGLTIDKIIGFEQVWFDAVTKLILTLIIVQLMLSIVDFLRTYFVNKLATRIVADLRKENFEKIFELPLSYYHNHQVGEILNYFTYHLELVLNGLLVALNQGIQSIVMIIGSAYLMVSINLWIGILVMTIGPISFFIARFISKRTVHGFRQYQKALNNYAVFMEEKIKGAKVIKMYQQQEAMSQLNKSWTSKLEELGLKANFYASLVNPTTRFVNYSAYILVGILGGILTIQGIITVGSVSSLLTYTNLFTKPINELTSTLTSIQESYVAVSELYKFHLVEKEKDFGELDLPPLKGKVEFSKVYFSYYKGQTLIQDLSFIVNPLEKVAIVGKTGAGKSTIINLILQFYRISSGSILFDDYNIKDYSLKSLRNQISLVLQDSWIFKGSIYENMVYGLENANEEAVLKIAQEIGIDEFVSVLPDGYQTIISNEDTKLSAGQKQLISIARALLVKRPLVVLDEATSQVDPSTEVLIQKALDKLMASKTSFVIAHRLATIKDAQLILVLENGIIVEKGNHEELLKQEGYYYNLYHSQYREGDLDENL